MVGDYMPDEVLGKIKEMINFKKFGDTKTLIETDDNCQVILFLKVLRY